MEDYSTKLQSGGGQGGGSPGEQGAGEGGKRKNRGREVGAEINKAIVCCLLLVIIQTKHLSSKVLKLTSTNA